MSKKKPIGINRIVTDFAPEIVHRLLENPFETLNSKLAELIGFIDPATLLVLKGIIDVQKRAGWENPTYHRFVMLLRLHYMMDSVVRLRPFCLNGLYDFVQPEFVKYIHDNLNVYVNNPDGHELPEEVKAASNGVLKEFGDERPLNEYWGLRMVVEMFIWSDLSCEQAYGIVLDALCNHKWDERNYVFNDPILPNLRTFLKSSPLKADGKVSTTSEQTKMRIWANAILGTLGKVE